MPTLTTSYDPTPGVPSRTVRGTRAAMEAYVADDLAYAEDMAEADVPGRVTCNTDATGSTYFLVWHLDDGTVQVDTFTITD
jgi:hypothetical protein